MNRRKFLRALAGAGAAVPAAAVAVTSAEGNASLQIFFNHEYVHTGRAYAEARRQQAALPSHTHSVKALVLGEHALHQADIARISDVLVR